MFHNPYHIHDYEDDGDSKWAYLIRYLLPMKLHTSKTPRAVLFTSLGALFYILQLHIFSYVFFLIPVINGLAVPFNSKSLLPRIDIHPSQFSNRVRSLIDAGFSSTLALFNTRNGEPMLPMPVPGPSASTKKLDVRQVNHDLKVVPALPQGLRYEPVADPAQAVRVHYCTPRLPGVYYNPNACEVGWICCPHTGTCCPVDAQAGTDASSTDSSLSGFGTWLYYPYCSMDGKACCNKPCRWSDKQQKYVSIVPTEWSEEKQQFVDTGAPVDYTD